MNKPRALTAFVLLLAVLALPGAVTAGVCRAAAAPAHEHGGPDHSGHAPAQDSDTGAGCQDSLTTSCGMTILLPASQEHTLVAPTISLELRAELRIPTAVPFTTVFHPPRI
jgi:hypothetical protein